MSIHPENLAILNIYAQNNRASKYIQQKLIILKGEIEKIQNYIKIFKYPFFNTVENS